jgi:hypothetical protein
MWAWPGGNQAELSPLDPARDEVEAVRMKQSRMPLGKIVNHANGLGAPSMETVRERATELAMIDGRTEYNERDWERAKVELHGGHSSIWGDSEDEMVASVSERDMTVSDLGHRVENIRYDDADNALELVAEGMDEAVHDQMLQAAKLGQEEQDGA